MHGEMREERREAQRKWKKKKRMRIGPGEGPVP